MKNDYYITCEEVMTLIGRKDTTAYNLIRKCNQELKAKGFLTVRGRTPRKYFMERMGLSDE